MNLIISFPDKKTHRKCAQYLRQFTGKKAFLAPSSREEYIQLIKERGLSMQFRGDKSRTYFPTKSGWQAFVNFTRLIHYADPFATRSTSNETHQAVQCAYANMLSDRLLPETIEDLVAYLPDSFKAALTNRAERRFSKVHGINIKGEIFFRVGYCLLGNYGSLCFESIPETENNHKKGALDAIEEVFEEDSAVVAGERNQGTADRVKEESEYQWDLALSVLCLMLNVTYKSAFDLLWQIRTLDRPEFGLATQRGFSIIEEPDLLPQRQLGYSIKFAEQWLNIDPSIIDNWHESLGLGVVNRLTTDPIYHDVQLVGRLVNAILYFRQAANQSTPELQMSTLWICVESFLTVNNENILNANKKGLAAIIISSLNRDYWPKGAKTPDALEKIFSKFYQYRSRTIHHGRRGHVSVQDVQEFSVVVSALILCVAIQIEKSLRTTEELAQVVQQFT